MNKAIKTCQCGKTYKSDAAFKKHVDSCKRVPTVVSPAAVSPAAVSPAAVSPAAVSPAAVSPSADSNYHVCVEKVAKPESFMQTSEKDIHKGIISDNILDATDDFVPHRTERMPEINTDVPDLNDPVHTIKRLESLVMTLLFTYNRARMLNDQLMMENDYFRTLFGIPKIIVSKKPAANTDEL